MKPCRILLLSLAIVLAASLCASAKLTLSGESVWKLGYGSRYYSSFGWKLGLGGFLASQELRLDVKGEIVEGLTLEAHLDNTKGDVFQQLTVGLSWQGLTASGGNIRYSPYIPSMGRPKSSIMGLSVAYGDEKVSAYAVGGKAQGAKGSRTFRGMTAQEKVEYVQDGPYMPARSEAGLVSSIEGLWHAASGADFDPALDEGSIVWEESSESGDIADYLSVNFLGQLCRTLTNPDGTLVPGQAYRSSSVDGLSGISGAYLMMRDLPLGIARKSVMELIGQYNSNLGLTGDSALKYPYVAGSATDTEFLTGLAEGWMSLAASSKATGELFAKVPFSQFERGRFYPLGSSDVLPESLILTAVAQGGSTIPLAATGASWNCYEDRGYLEMQLPSDFFDDYSAVVAGYSYRITQGMYFLGAGIIRGSVSVRLDGVLLKEGVDFDIDYETGVLVVAAQAGEGAEGLIEVEFEYETPGTKAWLAGIGVAYRPTDGLEILLEYCYSSDSPLRAEDETTVPRERSYDNLASAEVRWKPAEGISVDAGALFSASTFPGSDALRPNAPNAIASVAKLEDNAGGVWWAFASKAGVSVLSPYTGAWKAVGLPAALSGSPVHSAVSDGTYWYFGTGGGVARLGADYIGFGEGFADVTALWKTAGARQGMPSAEAVSLELFEGELYVGTPVGLVAGPADLDGPWRLYRPSEHVELGGGRVTGLVSTGAGLLVSTADSVALFDGTAFTRIYDSGAVSMAHAPLDGGIEAAAATGDGILLMKDGMVALTVMPPEDAVSAAGYGSFLYYVTPGGLFAYDLGLGIETRLAAMEGLTSAATDGLDVFAGGTADEDYSLPIVRLAYPMGAAVTLGPDTHGIDGRDRAHYILQDPSEHTSFGFGGYVSAGYDSDRLSVDASLKARSKGSLAGSGPGSPDSASFGLTLGWRPTSTLGLSLYESLVASKLWSYIAGTGALELTNVVQAGLSWKGPVTLSLSANYRITGRPGVERSRSQTAGASAGLQYSVGGLRLTGALSAFAKFNEDVEPFAYSTASLALYWQVSNHASIALSYVEPTPFGSLLRSAGNYRSVSGSYRYFAYTPTGSVSVTGKGNYRRDLKNASNIADVSAAWTYTARQLVFLGTSFLPRVELSVAYAAPQGADSRVSAYAKLSSGMSFGVFGADTSVSNKLTYMIESRRMLNSGEGSLTVRLGRTGWAVKPSLQLGASYLVETAYMAESKGSWKADAKLTLSSGGKVANQASLGYSYSNRKGGKHDIAISDSLSFTALEGKMSIGAGLSAGIGLVQSDIASSAYKASVDVSIGYRFDGNWSARAAGEVGLGASSLAGPPKALYGFEVTASLRF